VGHGDNEQCVVIVLIGCGGAERLRAFGAHESFGPVVETSLLKII
jgi:hypothetical protein